MQSILGYIILRGKWRQKATTVMQAPVRGPVTATCLANSSTSGRLCGICARCCIFLILQVDAWFQLLLWSPFLPSFLPSSHPPSLPSFLFHPVLISFNTGVTFSGKCCWLGPLPPFLVITLNYGVYFTFEGPRVWLVNEPNYEIIRVKNPNSCLRTLERNGHIISRLDKMGLAN